MPPRLSISFVLALLFVGIANAIETHPFSIADSADTKVAILIRAINSDSALVSINSDIPMVPASTTKVLTTATVLTTFPSFLTFSTNVYLKGEIQDSTFVGSIIINAGGDPTIESAYFPKHPSLTTNIAKAIKNKGITHIVGDIQVNDTRNIGSTPPRGWLKTDFQRPYGTGHHALNFRDNRVLFEFSKLRTTPALAPQDLSVEPGKHLSIVRDVKEKKLKISGNRAKHKFNGYLPMPNPIGAFCEALKSKFKASGIEFTDSITNSSSNSTLLLTHLSPQIDEISKSLLFRSDNQMAEGMLRLLAYGSSRDQAIGQELRVWRDRGIDMDPVIICDGSGLSRLNRLSAKFLADILAWVSNNRPDLEYHKMLPLSGKSGTLSRFLKGTCLDGRYAAKTGSLNNVQTYAGYILDENNKPSHIVVILVNDFKCNRSELRAEIERYLTSYFCQQESTDN